MMTGLFPPAHGIVRNRFRLKGGVVTLAQRLREEGFRTGAVVSAPTLDKGTTGLDRGFDYYDQDDQSQSRPELAVDRALAWLSTADPSRSTFLFFHTFAPHYPYNPPDPYAGHFIGDKPGFQYGVRSNADRLRMEPGLPGEIEEHVVRYDGEILYVDSYVHRLVGELKRRGYWDSALVIFVSDHGETLSERPWKFDHGGRVYDEQIRVPLIMHFPGGEYAGKRIESAVHHVDLTPTILDYLSVSSPKGVHGRSLLPWIQGSEEPDPKRTTFSLGRASPDRNPEYGRSDLISLGLTAAVREFPLKLIAHPARSGYAFLLFDLVDDPGETKDLSEAQPDEVIRLSGKLAQWLESVGGDLVEPAPKLPEDIEEALRALGYLE